ncbi:prephenate dehydratase [Marivirga lumbricoides]|uniref:prephenate dehydratase n=1 Tax=Marivirga lumbricoides TaxID=1046115 RepID=A0ABQ1MDP6_9BACT|nr:prephenate dehydratase [Marivirga lumbricoides]
MPLIAIQGVKGAFHEMAAKKFASKPIELLECMTFREECKALENDKADMAVMAVENSIAGSLSQNYGLINEYRLHVIGEVYLKIEMQLMALPGVKLEDIRHIISHPVAINQCSKFLDTLSNVNISEAKDTAESAKVIREKKLYDTAAIAGEGAASLYDLNILKKNIETDKQNFTRFLILTKESNNSPNDDKASISFELKHEPGTLADLLSVFKVHEINLTNIQSVPVIGKPYEYRFHADLTWNNKKQFEKALKIAEQFASSIILLGTYKKSSFNFE